MATSLTVLRDVLDRMHESVTVYDLEARIQYANPATERMFGRPLEEMAGQRLWDLFPEAVGNLFYQAFERVAAGGAEELFDHYYPPFDRWFANRIARNGQQVHVVARDVTDEVRRRRRIEALAHISHVLTTHDLDRKGATQAIADALEGVFEADCGLAVLSADRLWLDLVAVSQSDHLQGVVNNLSRFRADMGYPGEALRTRAVVHADALSAGGSMLQNTTPQLREIVDRYHPTSILVAPLLMGEDAIGVLTVTRRQGTRPLTEDDRTLVTEIAASVGLYLAHARRRAEATSLRDRLSAIADANPALVSFVDTEHRYQYVNAAYARWFDRPRESFLGQHIRCVLGPEAWQVIEPHLAVALSGTPVRFRSKLAYAFGERHVEAQYRPIIGATGDIEGLAVLVFDVSAEELLASAEQRRHEEERHATRRLESLLAVTGKLAGAHSADQIARVVVDEGVSALEASMGGLWMLTDDGCQLEILRKVGFPEAYGTSFDRVRLDEGRPLTDCIRSGRALWLESRADYAARYPQMETSFRPEPAPPLAFALLPLFVEGRTVGCLNFTFHDERRLTPDERTYLEVLASHTGEALRRAQLYAALRDASETREAMIRASPAAILLLDEAGMVHAWNPAAERILGWTAQEVLGRLMPAAAQDKRDELLAQLRHILAGNVIGGRETRQLHKSGDWIDVELYAAPVRLSDGRTMCLSMVVDISERKRTWRGQELIAGATTLLSRSLEGEQTLDRFVTLMVQDFSDLCLIDMLGEDGALHRVAMSRDEVAPGVCIPRRLEHAAKHGGSSLAIATQKPQILRDLDDAALIRLSRDDAHLRSLRALSARSMLSVPLLVGERLLGALSFTSKTRNFDEVDVVIARELASHAATAIENARLYEEARAARREAEAANRAKDQFLAMLGHELRNPLAPLSTAIDLMKLRAPEHFERERAVIERQVDHLMRLVDDLLDVARITRGKIELRREQTTLSAIVARAIELTSPLLEQRQQRLTIAIPPDLAVHGDPTRLSQVVANLVSNAAKYTEGQGHIEVRAQARGGNIVLVVRDDGIGIAPEMLPSIFEVFVQAPQNSARQQGGLGLGLAIVRNLVELHGGTVTAHSEGLGRGTELVVTLPAAPDKPTARPPLPPSRPARPVSGRRILVVDDNEDAAGLLGDALDALGHEIRTAFDGPSALRIALEFCPDIAVLDIGLPVMDGYELAQRLRASNASHSLRLIALTGYGQEGDRARAQAAGFDEHLTKPVPLAKLVRLVADLGVEGR